MISRFNECSFNSDSDKSIVQCYCESFTYGRCVNQGVMYPDYCEAMNYCCFEQTEDDARLDCFSHFRNWSTGWEFHNARDIIQESCISGGRSSDNASVISMDCRIVSLGGLEITQESHIVTCFNAANHKRMTMMRAGRIVLFKMKHNRAMKRVSTMAIRLSLASVTRATHSAHLNTQTTNNVSCLAAAKNKKMIKVERNVLPFSLQINLLLRPVVRIFL
jgi:hypothetical protein